MRKIMAMVMIAVLFALAISAQPTAAKGKVTKRPIEDFIDAQGTFMGPDWLIMYWNNDGDKVAIIDYAGLINMWIEEESGGTKSTGVEFSGTVTERPLADGRTEVHVNLHTTNAIIWIRDYTVASIIFGNSPNDVVGCAEPALAEVLYEIKYITTNPPGSPMLDLVQLYMDPTQVLTQELFNARGEGELHEAFGVEEGAPGQATVTMRGIHNAPGQINNPGLFWPEWPVGNIHIKAVGY